MRQNRTRKLTLTAVFAAFSTVFLYLASVLPTGQLGFLGVASLFGVAAVCEYGLAGGAFVFAVTALLGFFLVPDRMNVVLYVSFFGYYPILKALAEKCRVRAAEWAVKLAVFNAAVTVDLLLYRSLFLDGKPGPWLVLGVYALLNLVFVAFDIGVSRVISVYMAKIYPKMHTR